MNAHTRISNEIKLGIKAYQNFAGALEGFNRFSQIFASKDHLLLSAVFCFAIVKYAKPFTDTETSFGRTRYPVRHLKVESDFDHELHTHLIELRNTLIAHDDLESIEPRILQFCLSIAPSGFSVPISIGVSNKCLSYPIDTQSVEKLRAHVEACMHGAITKIHNDISKARDITLNHPEQAKEDAKYQKNYGQARIEATGSQLSPPDFMADEWLNSNEPSYEHIHNGLLYEELRIRRDFYGPETIKLPDGTSIQISPP